MHEPKRMCVACRQIKAKDELLRIVKTNELLLDTNKQIDGRGAYLCKKEKCLEKAFKKNLFYHKLRLSFEIQLFEKIKKVINE